MCMYYASQDCEHSVNPSERPQGFDIMIALFFLTFKCPSVVEEIFLSFVLFMQPHHNTD